MNMRDLIKLCEQSVPNPFDDSVWYRGTNTPGRMVGDGRNGDMLGPGIYLTNDREYASNFGKHVEEYHVSLSSVLRTWEHPNMSGKDINNFARQKGYDAILAPVGKGTYQLCVLRPDDVSPVVDEGLFEGKAGVFEDVRLFEDHLTAQIEDACVKRVIDDLDLNRSYDNADDIAYAYEDENGEEPDTDSPEFREYAEGWVRDKVGDAYYKFSHLVKNNQIRAWRVIKAPPNWTPEGKHVGIYWSWDKNAADAHWGDPNGQVKWRIEALLPVSGIDWVATISQNAIPAYEEEREIRINPDTPIEIVRYEVIK